MLVAAGAILLCLACAQRVTPGNVDGSGDGSSDEATAPELAVEAVGDALFARQDHPLEFPLSALFRNDIDADGESVTLHVNDDESLGTIAVVTDVLTYRPRTGRWGLDRFSYELDDGRGQVSRAEVVVYVSANEVSVDDTPEGYTAFAVEAGTPVPESRVWSVGDVDGDGREDLLLAHFVEPGFADAYVVAFGGASDAVTLDAVLEGGAGGLVVTLEGLEHEVTAGPAGDFNGDGLADVAMGSAGHAAVVFGTAGGPPRAFEDLGDAAFVLEDLGIVGAIAEVGDINGDGLGDIAVRGYLDHLWETVIVFGRADPKNIVVGAIEYGGDNGYVIRDFERSGAISGVGDINDDGYADLLAGFPESDVYETSGGRAALVFGAPQEGTLDLDSALGAGGFQIAPPTNSDAVGSAVAGPGDVNGDGVRDLLIGGVNTSPLDHSAPESNPGRAWVVFGKPDEATVALSDLDDELGGGFSILPPPGYHGVGGSVGGAGDLDGDGLADVVVSGLSDSGHARVWVVYGADDPARVHLETLSETGRGYAIDAGGAPAPPDVSVIQLDQDGLPDVLVGWTGGDRLARVLPSVPTHETCCRAHPGRGCTNPAVAECVCEDQPDCCQVQWTMDCAEAAATCGACGP